MPKRKSLTRADAIAMAQGEVQPSTAEIIKEGGFPSPDEQQEAFIEPEHHTINLLDGTSLSFAKKLTIGDIRKKRIDAAVQGLFLLLNTEAAKFESEMGKNMSFALALTDDKVFQMGINVLAKICSVSADIFKENISYEEFQSAIMAAINMVGEITKKELAGK